MKTAPRAAADRQGRRRLPLHRGRPAPARRHLVVVGEHPRPLASAAEPRRWPSRRSGSSTSCSPAARTRPAVDLAERLVAAAAAGPDAGLLLRQRLDGRRSGAEARAPVLAQPRPAASAARSSRCITRITATRSARCRPAKSRCSRSAFAPMLFDVTRADAPYCYRCPLGLERASCQIDCLGSLEAALQRHGDTVAAVLVEPMLQAAGGMIVWPREFLAGARRLCDRIRHAADCRRSADRIRPHRPHVRVRARRDHARHHLPVEGAHGGLPAARRHRDDRADLRRVSQRRSREDVLSRPFVHRQSAGLRGRRARASICFASPTCSAASAASRRSCARV